MSLKYGLKVYGIDSSNTHGAEERNRKLKKHWKVYRRRSKPDVSGLALQTTKERKVQDETKCKADIEGICNNSNANQDGGSIFTSLVIRFILIQALYSPYNTSLKKDHLQVFECKPTLHILRLAVTNPTYGLITG